LSIIQGDALHLPLADGSIDAVVCDPPYNLSFMGKGWDTHSSPAAFAEWCETWAREAYRVLKPGGHLLAFGGTRTSHRLACGIEDAGFEIRDAITWLYSQGFPKSLDVGKAIDKANGKHTRDLSVFGAYVRERRTAKGWSLRQLDDVMCTNTAASWWEGRKSGVQPPGGETYRHLKAVLDMSDMFDDLIEWCEAEREKTGERSVPVGHAFAGDTYGGDSSCRNMDVTIPATNAAKQWDGWGTALKPASEPIIVARKPLGERTVAGNVQTWGTGAINVDGCRVGTESHAAGRWPTNCVLTHTPDCAEVGTRKVKSGTAVKSGKTPGAPEKSDIYGVYAQVVGPDQTFAAADGTETIPAYECAAGCPVAELDAQSGTLTSNGVVQPFTGKRKDAEVYGQYAQSFVAPVPTTSGGASRFFPTFRYQAKAPTKERVKVDGVSHPTTKPLELMRWLVRLVTPPGGRVLDPFSGSGTTAEACILEGFECVAIERDATYLPLIAARVKRQAPAIVGEDIPADIPAEVIRLGQLTLEVTV